jgi:ferredoxin
MQALKDLARQLLTEKTVGLFVGYEQGPRSARPAFITNPNDVDRLIFDSRCVHNLAAYLSPRRSHLTSLGKKAVVVKGCDARAVAGLIREGQLKREDIVIVAVRCGGVGSDPLNSSVLDEKSVSAKCDQCDVREPKLFDHIIGDLPKAPPASSYRKDRIAALDAMSTQERWAFWSEEMQRCIRCHACREVCPMCFCERCVADKTQPQWIESSPHPRANFAWQMTRVMHLAGRCIDCGECERACPSAIPLGLLTQKVAQVVLTRYGYRASDDPSIPTPIGAFRHDDQQEFIL